MSNTIEQNRVAILLTLTATKDGKTLEAPLYAKTIHYCTGMYYKQVECKELKYRVVAHRILMVETVFHTFCTYTSHYSKHKNILPCNVKTKFSLFAELILYLKTNTPLHIYCDNKITAISVA